MLRILFFILIGFWALPRLMRWLGRSAIAHRQSRPDLDRSTPTESLKDLTQQDISDVDFEEIPPEE